MTWKHNTPAGWAWLLFAGISFVVACMNDVPDLLAGLIVAPDWKLVSRVINLICVVGLCQYAIRWRSPRTTRFWRAFSPVMLITFTVMIAYLLPLTLKVLIDAAQVPWSFLAVVLMFAIVVANTAFTALAVLRLGDYLGPTRRPLGLKPAQLSLDFS